MTKHLGLKKMDTDLLMVAQRLVQRYATDGKHPLTQEQLDSNPEVQDIIQKYGKKFYGGEGFIKGRINEIAGHLEEAIFFNSLRSEYVRRFIEPHLDYLLMCTVFDKFDMRDRDKNLQQRNLAILHEQPTVLIEQVLADGYQNLLERQTE